MLNRYLGDLAQKDLVDDQSRAQVMGRAASHSRKKPRAEERFEIQNVVQRTVMLERLKLSKSA